MKYMFDWGSGTCLWSENKPAIERYDYPVEIDKLPISYELKGYLAKLVERHDMALNWDNPSGDLMWSEEEQRHFIEDATDGYKRLCRELGDKYLVRLAELI